MWTTCSGFYSAKVSKYLATPAAWKRLQERLLLMLINFAFLAAKSDAEEDNSKYVGSHSETMTLRKEGEEGDFCKGLVFCKIQQ